jgi:hypothetical protein
MELSTLSKRNGVKSGIEYNMLFDTFEKLLLTSQTYWFTVKTGKNQSTLLWHNNTTKTKKNQNPKDI